MEWLTDNPWVAWVGVALILAAIEAATVDFVFVMLAGGALAGGLAAALGGNVTVQVIVAIVVAALLLFVVRPIVKRKFTDGVTDHNIGAAGLVGRQARVLQTVTDTDGRIKLAGETWSARIAEGAQPLRPGDDAVVIAIQGATAFVAADPH
ncbi:membrane protein implicated in regulation of membrane protease activity [Knoellia remsis]|uniref:Membrane protein implicated in regulation of membrane protease activity n=1 Tax=Knoellia remsis TaxID=407159 RepID=A0A2T0TT90_9MICO|nr:NfeD family protein [Knoellia remsis]PRY48914.1 membrane protein implicated in regulation of membrane protease activity [Knoellia remsis]